MKDSINVFNLVERCMPTDFQTPSHTNIMNDEIMDQMKVIFADKYTKTAKSTVDAFDQNNDGKLSVTEIADFFPVDRCMNSNSQLMNQLKAMEMVNMLDRDGDHKVSVQELARGIRMAESPAIGVLKDLDDWADFRDKTHIRTSDLPAELPITINPIWAPKPDPIWDRHPKINLYRNDELPNLILE